MTDARRICDLSQTLWPHSGAHADASLHYDPAGAAMAEVGLDAYIGPARLVDLASHVGLIALPLKLVGLDASPVRAVLRELSA